MTQTINENRKKSKLTKKAKIWIIIGVVLAVILGGVIYVATNSASIKSNIVYAMIDSKFDYEADDGSVVIFYKVRNENYDYKKNSSQPIEVVKFYYYENNDTSGKKIYVDSMDDVEIDGNKYSPTIYSLAALMGKYKKVQNIGIKVLWVAVALLVVGGIVIWFLIWSKHEDEQKAKIYGPKISDSKKQNNKKIDKEKNNKK